MRARTAERGDFGANGSFFNRVNITRTVIIRCRFSLFIFVAPEANTRYSVVIIVMLR